MKIFLIVIGCILLYIFGAFVSYTRVLYFYKCSGKSISDKYINTNAVDFALLWPVTVPFTILINVVHFFGKILKKFSITIVEILYQLNHKEGKDGNDD